MSKNLIKIKLNNILIVRDGGGKEYDKIFKELKSLNCKILVHTQNRGKGTALKTGFSYISRVDDIKGVVTVDSDGQHKPQDILKVAKKLRENPSDLILGVRDFEKSVPLRSKFGNILTKKIFYLLTGKKVSDTQTGLRGISKKYLDDFINIKGDKYEYEMNMLTFANSLKITIIEVPIEKGNKYRKNEESP